MEDKVIMTYQQQIKESKCKNIDVVIIKESSEPIIASKEYPHCFL